jgi:uncharacterized protein (DUF4415 family)
MIVSKTATHPSSKADDGQDRTDWAAFDAHVITQEEYEEIPELTEAEIAAGFMTLSGHVRNPGRPKDQWKKLHVSIRLSRDVLDHFKAGGPGWQTRIDEALKRVVVQERAARSVALDAEERAARAAAKTAAE